MLEAVIFDMDGLMVNSEPVWKKAEQIAFREVNLELTDAMCSTTTGYDCWDVIKHWYNYHPWDIKKKSFSDLKKHIDELFFEIIETDGHLLPGVNETIEFFVKQKIPMAVASSAPLHIIHHVLQIFQLNQFFPIVCSSDQQEYGKPHPAVYQHAIRKLKTNPLNCLAFEDSFYGMIAAKAARLKVIGVPEEGDFQNTRYDFVDLKLESLDSFVMNVSSIIKELFGEPLTVTRRT
jgi:sugar-phosphatase